MRHFDVIFPNDVISSIGLQIADADTILDGCEMFQEIQILNLSQAISHENCNRSRDTKIEKMFKERVCRQSIHN